MRWAANPALKLEFLARGGYQQALPGLLMQQKVSTVLASATAATTWQLRRGIGEIGATVAQVAEQGQLFSPEGRKTMGDKAFEQLVALPFASLSSGAAALLPNAGRFAIPSQALSDTGFGVAEGQITTWQSEGRWMNHLELFTHTYASGLGSANNLILHPNNLRYGAAEQPAASWAGRPLPSLEHIAPQERGSFVAKAMEEAIGRYRAEGDPRHLNDAMIWANAHAKRHRKLWSSEHRQAYVRLGAEMNRLLSPSATNTARPVDHLARPSAPSALVRVEDAAGARSNAQDSAGEAAAPWSPAYNHIIPFTRPGFSEADRLLAIHNVPRSIFPGTAAHRAAAGMRMAMNPWSDPNQGQRKYGNFIAMRLQLERSSGSSRVSRVTAIHQAHPVQRHTFKLLIRVGFKSFRTSLLTRVGMLLTS
jgi:hypothetical protein